MEIKTGNFHTGLGLRALDTTYESPNQKRKLHFKARDPVNYFQKTTEHGIQTFTNAHKVASAIDSILGDNFFSAALNKAGIAITDDKIVLEKEKMSDKIIQTLRYPIFDLKNDLAIFLLKPLTKDASPFKKLADSVLSSQTIQKRIKEKEVQSSLSIVRSVLDEFSPTNEKNARFMINEAATRFKKVSADGITKIAKNYASRDERTLNRMVTSTVSALYSSADFYNISMLQKDDHKEARDAEKSRFKQEMTRMGLSAGLTFLTLGILEDKTKKSVALNALVIAASALISEVISRVINKVPLHPLTPEQAEKIALKKEKNNSEKEAKSNLETGNIKFKSNYKNTAFEGFTDRDGNLTSVKKLLEYSEDKIDTNNQTEQNNLNKQNKNHDIKKIILALFSGASIVYLMSKFGPAKGMFNKISDFAGKIKEVITTKKVKVNLDELDLKIQNFKMTPEGSDLVKIMEEYQSYISHFRFNDKVSEITTRKDRLLLPGVYNGATKIFSTLYQILSAPGRLVNIIVEKLSSKGNPQKSFDVVKKPSDMKKELSALSDILSKNDSLSEKAQIIKKKIRNIETAAETGELASLSRTLVTAISTYFFVNDYTNKVLIESKGKDVESAKEERNERIAHKISNFFFNGMLMNLFNSVFKVPLNNSLWQAGIIAGATEATNEFLVRKSICQPVGRLKSRQAIIDYEEAQTKKKGFMGAWSRFFRKVTGKKTLTQKAGIDTNDKKHISKK